MTFQIVDDLTSHIGHFLIFGVIVAVIFMILKSFIKGLRCPSCNKFSGTTSEEKIIKKEDVYVKVETKTKDKKGEVMYTTEQLVPGERITYKVTHTCKNCGYKTYSTHTKDVPKI